MKKNFQLCEDQYLEKFQRSFSEDSAQNNTALVRKVGEVCQEQDLDGTRQWPSLSEFFPYSDQVAKDMLFVS